MYRKEVIVDGKVFDLGLKELTETLANRSGELKTLELEVAGTIFQVGFTKPEHALILNWWGLTNARNIVWTRFIFLRLRRPFVRRASCFTYAKEGILEC